MVFVFSIHNGRTIQVEIDLAFLKRLINSENALTSRKWTPLYCGGFIGD